MQRVFILSVLLLACGTLFSRNILVPGDSLVWKKLSTTGYTIHYTAGDEDQLHKLDVYLQSGIGHIAGFFQHRFQNMFDIYIFPGRSSLDKQWQKDWDDPTFKSECWMIASGVAHRLDVLSPNAWTKEACDHHANDSTEVKQLLWHELVHVFHGQHNPDHTFNYIEKLDWLVEGVATFVSGQLDERRLQRIKQLVKEDKAPGTLDNFWKGTEKYGLSGSVIAYIDKTYGRQKLFDLLTLTNKPDVLKSLGLSEEQLIKNWKEFLSP